MRVGLMDRTGRVVVAVLAVIFAILTAGILQSAYAQKQNVRKQQESYTRPAPTRQQHPTIPSANRYQSDKVFLEYADSLYRPANEYEEFQIVKGSVKFRHGGMWMYCDSAYYYPDRNSLDAYGHVRMEQGDTLFVYGDKLYYDGAAKHATLMRGPSRSQVELKNRNVTLVTDSLEYDLNSEIGWYEHGGHLSDDVNTLTSMYGEYSPATKLAKFRYNVLLVNNRDGYRMITEELDYNTDTHIADINTATRIEGKQDTIITTQGYYDTSTDHAELTSRSTIIHTDSINRVTTLEGDSIIYDKATRLSRAYMFRDPAKLPAPMVLTDTARKVILIGGYGEYNDSSRRALSTHYPLLMEFSRPDTLFLRADTILTEIEVVKVWPDSLSKNISAETRARLAAFGSLQEIADSMPLRLQLTPYGWKWPQTDAHSSDRTESETPASRPAKDIVASDSTIGTHIDKYGRDSLYMVPKDFHIAKAWPRARFFNQDIQGVADTLRFVERDSTLYLLRKPIVWSGERQVAGDRIDVHFNDSTVDWAHLPRGGMVAEHIDENFYNQLSGKDLMAYFENKTLRRLEVNGNVETIILPQENDSSYNKLVNAESSYLTVDMTKEKKIDHLKMWPEVTGSVIPIFDVKKSQQFLPGFRWYEALRPRRAWYGDRLKWDDELGEVPEALEEYFKAE